MTNKLMTLAAAAFSLFALVSVPACAVAEGPDEDIAAGSRGGELDDTRIDEEQPEIATAEGRPDALEIHRDQTAPLSDDGARAGRDRRFVEDVPTTGDLDVATAETADEDRVDAIELADVLEDLRARTRR